MPTAEQGDCELGLPLPKDAQDGGLLGCERLPCCAHLVLAQQLHNALQQPQHIRLQTVCSLAVQVLAPKMCRTAAFWLSAATLLCTAGAPLAASPHPARQDKHVKIVTFVTRKIIACCSASNCLDPPKIALPATKDCSCKADAAPQRCRRALFSRTGKPCCRKLRSSMCGKELSGPSISYVGGSKRV